MASKFDRSVLIFTSFRHVHSNKFEAGGILHGYCNGFRLNDAKECKTPTSTVGISLTNCQGEAYRGN